MPDRFWVGGTANWDNTAGTKWSTTSGGAGGASVPTSADDVFFTNLSTGTCTIATGNTGAKSINCTGFAGTIAGASSTITVAGSITLVAGMGYTHTGTVTITGTGTLTTAGKSFSTLTINGSGITVQLADALNVVGRTITITQGTFTTNNFNITAGNFQFSGTSSRTINLGSSTLTLSGSTQVIFTISTSGLTFNAGTSTINLSGTTAQLNTPGLTFNNVAFTSSSRGEFVIRSVLGSNTFNNLTITGPGSAGYNTCTFSGNQVINGVFSTTGTAGNRRPFISSGTYGVRRTLTVNGSTSLTDADFRDIIVNGTAAPISGTRIGNRGACAGITFDAPKTVYFNVSSGSASFSTTSWSTTPGGANSANNFPLPQDTAIVRDSASAVTLIFNSDFTYIPTFDFTQKVSAALTVSFSNIQTAYGSWTNGATTTLSDTATLTFGGEGTKVITSAGKVFLNSVVVDAYGGAVELADAFSMTGANNTLTVTNGTFDVKDYTISVPAFSSSNSNVRSIKFGPTAAVNLITTASTSALNFSTSTNLTFDAGTTPINISGAPSTNSTLTFDGGGQTFYNLSYTSNTTNDFVCSITGANTFNNVTFTPMSSTGIRRIQIGADQTISGTLTTAGASAIRRIFLFSNTPGTTRTITANAISANYCDFRDITIAGTAVGSVGASPTGAGDCGNNAGIIFPAPKTVYRNSASSGWSATGWALTSGGGTNVNNFPLAQDTAIINNTSAGSTLTFDWNWNIGTFDGSARTNAITLSGTDRVVSVYGSWSFGSGFTHTVSTTNSLVFTGRGSNTINCNGVAFGTTVNINCVTGTVTLSSAYLSPAGAGSSQPLILSSGTFDAATYNVTTSRFTVSGASILFMGTGLWTLTGAGTGGSASWGVGGTITFYKGTANILFSGTGVNAREFNGGGLSYNKFTIGGATGSSTTTINGANQFTELASTKTVAHVITLGSSQTFGKWSVTGSAGNVVTVSGGTTGNVLVGSATTGINYLAMSTTAFSSTASTAEFYAGANSTGSAAAPVYRTATPAARTLYWVGGTGNWSDTARWSLSSGGAGGQPVPRSTDDVVFDSASNATAYTATIDAITGGNRCNSLTISGPASGNLTLAGSTALFIHGNVTLPATGLTRTYTGTITLSGSTTGKTFTTNGVTIAGNPVINGVGCGWTLGSALSDGGAGSTWTITNGTFDTGNYSVSVGALSSSNSNSRTINLGSSAITIQALPTGFTNSINLTFNAGTSTISCTSNSTINGGGLTFYDVAFTSTFTGAITINGINTFNNLSVTGITSAGLKNINLSAAQTINGTLTLSAGTNATMRTFIRSDTTGTTRTLTCNAVSATDVDFRDITIAGSAAPVSGTRLGDCKGNSGITFDAPKTVYWNLAGNNQWSDTAWATSAGGTPAVNNFPLAQDTAVFTSTSPASGQTTNIGVSYNIGTIDMSARTSNTIALNVAAPQTIYGNWINGTGTTLSAMGILTFAGRGSQTITSAGKTFTQPITIDSPSGTVQLGDPFNSSSNITHTRGTFDAVLYNLNCQQFYSTSSSTRTLNMGSGLWTLTGIGTSISNAPWSVSISSLSFNKGTANILFSNTSTSARTFYGGSLPYNKLTIGGVTGTSTFTFNGDNTFTELASTKTVAHTIALGTTTQRVGAFTGTGTAGNVLTITGDTSNLIYTGGGTVGTGVDYLNVQGRAYGPNGETSGVWYAGNNSINSGSLGWEFTTGGSITYNVDITEPYTSENTQDTSANVFNSSAAENSNLADIQIAAGTYAATITENSDIADLSDAGFTLTVSITEATTLAEFQEFVNLIAVFIVENSSLADAESVLTAFNAAITENTDIADAALAAGVFSVSLSENATLADTASVQAVFNTLRAEGLTSADIQAVARVVLVSLTEGTSVADTEVATSAFLASITEDVISESVESALKQLVGVVAENLNSAEAQTTQTNFNAARVEPVTSADIAQAQTDFNAAIAEATTVADILNAVRTLVGSITENSGLADTEDRTAIFFRSDIEGLISQDNQAAQANFNSNAVENVVVSTQQVGYGWFRVVDDQTIVWTAVNNTQSITWTNVGDDQNPNWVEINNSQP